MTKDEQQVLSQVLRTVPQERAHFIRHMPDPLKKYHNKIGKLLERHIQSTLILYFEIGEILCDATSEMKERADRQVGEMKHVRLCPAIVAEALGVSDRVLYHCRDFARTYSRDDVQELLGISAMTWTHVTHLLTVDTEQIRSEMLQKVREEHLTCTELRKEIRKRQGKAGSKSNRKRGLPANPSIALGQMAEETNRVLHAMSDIWFGNRYNIVTELRHPNDFNLSDETWNRLDQAILTEETAAVQHGRAAEDLKQIRGEIEQRRVVVAEAAEEDE
jgi:hypothetical protein